MASINSLTVSLILLQAQLIYNSAFIITIQLLNFYISTGTSPHSITSPALLEDGEYSFIIRYDPNRVECRQKQTTYISFEIIRQE